MAYSLKIPDKFKKAGWHAKIRNHERNEQPHVTLMRRNLNWRLGLRSLQFMDKKPPARDVPAELLKFVKKAGNLTKLKKEWDKAYPENKV